MKTRFLCLAAVIGLFSLPAEAGQYLFTLNGSVTSLTQSTTLFTVGNTFTAQFVVDTSSTTDSQPGDAHVGDFAQSTSHSIQFSNGLVQSAGPFDYMVISALYFAPLSATYDAVAFYAPNYGVASSNPLIGFEMRLPLGTFSGDSLQIPNNPITPVNNDFFYSHPAAQPGLSVFGSISSISVVAIPELGCNALGMSLGAILLIGFKRRGIFRRSNGS